MFQRIVLEKFYEVWANNFKDFFGKIFVYFKEISGSLSVSFWRNQLKL